MTKEEQMQVLEIAIKTAIEVLGNEKEEQPTIPMFKEAEEAYKAWTGEEMGKTKADRAFIPPPKNCAECWEKSLHVAVDCKAKGDCGWDGDERAEDCPIVRPQGEWINKDVVQNEDNTIGEWQECQCSVCGKWHTTPYMYYFNNYNYCPNCGAKMGGDGE